MFDIEKNSDLDNSISTSETSNENNIFKLLFGYPPELKECLELNKKQDEEYFRNNLYFINNELFPIDEYNTNTIENGNIFLGKKIEANDISNEVSGNKLYPKKEKIFIINKLIYRLDYYIMAFKTNFLEYVQDKLNFLINKIDLCKKFGSHFIHTPNRKLYGGNPKEKDNREFINKTVEEVFIDQTIIKIKKNKNNILIYDDENKNGISRQKDNENIFNKIKNKICLANFENSQKYKEQSDSIEILTKFLNTKIRDVLDEYYDSNKFKIFGSSSKIKYYDEKFKKERNRNFSLLEKNNFVKLSEMPFYSKKNK